MTWTIGEVWSPIDWHEGIMVGIKSIVSHTVSCAIEPSAKILWVETPVELEKAAEKIRNLHIYDYNLFWMNIRQNVKQLIDAFPSR